MKICVIGTGYVGLVDGACFAETGNEVTCVDVDQEKINLLLQGTIPIYEPGLAEIVERNVADNRLHFTTDLTQAVQNSEICFISVGTPPNEDGSADLSHVLAAAKDIAQAMNGYKVIVDKSTVPVGTADKVAEVIAQNSDQPFDVVSNPEFLKEGNAIDDFLQPDRIVVGANSDKAFKMMAELYSPFTTAGASLIKMDTRSAEMTKYAANAMLATRISFMNDLANLCEIVGADINLIRQGIGSDTRIGNTFLLAGAGYGGSCFPKDVKAIIKTAKENGYRLRLLESVEDVNHDQKQVVAKKTIQYFAGDLTGKTIAIWGLAFKAGTDDMREATSIDTIDLLLAAGATIKAHDPEALQTARRVFGDKITYSDKNYEILDGADALLVLTEWNEYREPDFDKIKNSLKQPVIFDGRNMYNKKYLNEIGIGYYGIGV